MAQAIVECLFEQVPLSDRAVFKVSNRSLTWVEGGDKLHSVGKVVRPAVQEAKLQGLQGGGRSMEMVL